VDLELISGHTVMVIVIIGQNIQSDLCITATQKTSD